MIKNLKSQLGLAPIIIVLSIFGVILFGGGITYFLRIEPEPVTIEEPEPTLTIEEPGPTLTIEEPGPTLTDIVKTMKVKVPVIIPGGAPPLNFDDPNKMREDKETGRRIGCGDRIAFIEREVEFTTQPLRAIYQELFRGSEIVVGTEYINPIAWHNKERTINSGNGFLITRPLQFDRVVIKNGLAVVHLTGDYITIGTCEPPLVEAVLEFAAKQFPWIKEINIYIEGTEAEFIHGGL